MKQVIDKEMLIQAFRPLIKEDPDVFQSIIKGAINETKEEEVGEEFEGLLLSYATHFQTVTIGAKWWTCSIGIATLRACLTVGLTVSGSGLTTGVGTTKIVSRSSTA